MPAQAQLDPELIQRFNNRLANEAVTAVEVFSAARVVSAGNFHYDNTASPDVDFATLKLPGSFNLNSETNRLTFFVDGHLGWFDLDQNAVSLSNRLGQLSVQSFTAAAGLGATWHANEWLSITPRFRLAYSHVWQDFSYSAPPTDPLYGAYIDYEADVLTLLPSVELQARRTFGRWEMSGGLSFTYLWTRDFHTDTPLIHVDSESHVWRTSLGARYHSDWKVLSLPVVPFTSFSRYDLGGFITKSGFVDHFYEGRLGVGCKLPDSLRPFRELELSGAYYFGDPLSGYSIGVSASF